MSDDFEPSTKDVPNSLLNPPRALAGWMTGLGLWGLTLGILNIMGMAYPGEMKVSWAGFLTVGILGEGVVYNTDFHTVSDTVFLLGCGFITGVGIKALNETEGGVDGWFKSLVINDKWTALVSFEEGGWEKTMGAWCMLIGLAFYIGWGIMHTAWVDPGVYSVFAALFIFGYALSGMPDHHDAPVPKE